MLLVAVQAIGAMLTVIKYYSAGNRTFVAPVLAIITCAITAGTLLSSGATILGVGYIVAVCMSIRWLIKKRRNNER